MKGYLGGGDSVEVDGDAVTLKTAGSRNGLKCGGAVKWYKHKVVPIYI